MYTQGLHTVNLCIVRNNVCALATFPFPKTKLCAVGCDWRHLLSVCFVMEANSGVSKELLTGLKYGGKKEME